MVAVLRQVSKSPLDGVVGVMFSGPPARRRGRPRAGSPTPSAWMPPLSPRNRAVDKILDGYFADLRKYEPLTMEQERELFIRYHAGDEGAREEIVLHNLRFVVRVAKTYAGSGMPLTDLISEGNYGLVQAIDKFDIDKNFKFISYAVWWIRQAILRAISTQSRQVRVPLNQTQKIVGISKATERLQQKNQRDPSPEEIADELDISPDEVVNMIRVTTPHTSIDNPLRNGKATFSEIIPDKQDSVLDKIVSEDLSMEMLDALSILGSKEKEAVLQYFGFESEHDPTLQEIGDKMGVSRERVRQLRDRALKKLRAHMEGRQLKGDQDGREKKGAGGEKAQEV